MLDDVFCRPEKKSNRQYTTGLQTSTEGNSPKLKGIWAVPKVKQGRRRGFSQGFCSTKGDSGRANAVGGVATEINVVISEVVWGCSKHSETKSGSFIEFSSCKIKE